MFQFDRTVQRQLFAFSPRDMVPADSDVWLYEEIFEVLDLEDFEWDYGTQGQSAKHPRLMLRTLFYGLAHGIVSGRRLAELCKNDLRFLVLCGDLRPDSRTIHRFIRRHESRMPVLFAQIVQLAMEMGLAKLGRVALDGTRLKANTSPHKAMSYEKMKEAVDLLTSDLRKLKRDLKKLNQEDEPFSELPDEIRTREARLAKILEAKKSLEDEKGAKISAKAQKSFHDHDALPMSYKGKPFQYGYNAQAAVDEDNQIIVACDIHGNQADCNASGPLLTQMKENCGQGASEILGDSGYRSAADIQAIEATGALPFVAIGKGESSSGTTVDDQLTATEDTNGYRCLANKLLPIEGRRKDGSTEVIVTDAFCCRCAFQSQCKLFAKKGKVYTIRPRAEWNAVQRNRIRMRSATGKGVYRRRKAIVEPVFGNIKTKGIRVNVIGLEKVRTWWQMVCAALNLEKIARFLAVLRDSLDLFSLVIRLYAVFRWSFRYRDANSYRFFSRPREIARLAPFECAAAS